MVDRSAITLKLMTYAPTGSARRRAHGRAARADRRRTQLGLPVHLDPGRLLLDPRAARAGLHRGGPCVRGMARASAPTSRWGTRPVRSRSCTASTARPTSRRRSSTTSRATRARSRYGSATAPPTSSSSTSTARHWTPSGLGDRNGIRVGHRRLDQAQPGRSTGCASNWDQPDEGIWETRGGRQDFTYGRVQCWVALDRMIRMAAEHGRPADLDRWISERDSIYRSDLLRGAGARADAAFVGCFSGIEPARGGPRLLERPARPGR